MNIVRGLPSGNMKLKDYLVLLKVERGQGQHQQVQPVRGVLRQGVEHEDIPQAPVHRPLQQPDGQEG